jgi:hypothetical protein
MAEAKKKYDDKFCLKMELCHGTFKNDGKLTIFKEKRKNEILF